MQQQADSVFRYPAYAYTMYIFHLLWPVKTSLLSFEYIFLLVGLYESTTSKETRFLDKIMNSKDQKT